MRLFFAILYILLSISGLTQTNKNVLGTFAAGCKVFNYEFRKTPNGLYSFKVDNIDKENNNVVFNKDTILAIQNNIKTISDSLDVLSKTIEGSSVLSGTKKDSLNKVLDIYNVFLRKIATDSSNWNFWKVYKDSIQTLLRMGSAAGIMRYDSILIRYNRSSSLKGFNTQLESIANTLSDITDSKIYTFNEFKIETFKPLCEYILNQRKILFLKECYSDTSIKDITLSIFYQIKAKLELKDDEPTTAFLKLKNQTLNCYYSETAYIQNFKSDKSLIKNKFIVDNVSVEFEDGTIKNMFADLYLADESGKEISKLPIRFKNTTPISISSKNDKDRFSNINIYVSDFGAVKSKIRVKVDNSISNQKQFSFLGYSSEPIVVDENLKDFNFGNIYFVLSDLIDYVDVLETDKEDYSPVNSVVSVNKNNPVQELKKEKRSRIITVRTYTDFIGIQGDQPNGLIQIEASRKFNLYTRRGGYKNLYFGVFTYIEPKLTFSKIEKNKNTLNFTSTDLDLFELSTNKRKVFKTPTINILKYQNSSFDIDLNYAKYNFTNIKSNIQINLSAGILRTGVSDTLAVSGTSIVKSDIPNNSIINTFRYGFSFIYELKPDSRYGLSLGYDYRAYRLLSDSYYLAFSNNNIINSFWADAYLKTNDENMLFFRYKISYVAPAIKQNFVQIQLGYLLDLFKTSSK